MLSYEQSSRFLFVLFKTDRAMFLNTAHCSKSGSYSLLELNILSCKEYNHVTILNVSFQSQVKINQLYEITNLTL